MKAGRDVSHGVYQKTSIKTELFIRPNLDTTFVYINARQYFTHGVFRKTSIKTMLFLLIKVNTKFFLNKSRMRRFSRCVPKNFYKKLNCLYYPPWKQFLSKQMQDNTLLTVCTEKRLLNLSFFQYSRWIQNFSKKRRTILYSRRAPKKV